MSERRHGTRAKYTFEKCRCEACRRANSDYQKRRARLKAYGLPAQVAAAPVREHVRTLMSSRFPGANDGIGWRRVADLAGVNRSTVQALVFGRRDRPIRRIKRENAEKLMAVHPDDLADGALVWAEDTWRYVRVWKVRAVERLHWSVFKASGEFRACCGCPMPDHVAEWLDEASGRPERLRRAGVA